MNYYQYTVIVDRTTAHERIIVAANMSDARAHLDAFCNMVGGAHTIGPVEVNHDDQ